MDGVFVAYFERKTEREWKTYFHEEEEEAKAKRTGGEQAEREPRAGGTGVPGVTINNQLLETRYQYGKLSYFRESRL